MPLCKRKKGAATRRTIPAVQQREWQAASFATTEAQRAAFLRCALRNAARCGARLSALPANASQAPAGLLAARRNRDQVEPEVLFDLAAAHGLYPGAAARSAFQQEAVGAA